MKGGVFVEILMVKFVEDFFKALLKIFKIDQDPNFIKLLPPDRNFYFPIVPVRALTGARIVSQIMSGSEFASYGEFKHRLIGGGAGIRTPE